MIHISLSMHEGKIKDLNISGHSGSADKGQDLVCAAVSAIAFGMCNALDQMGSDASIAVKSNSIAVQVNTAEEKTETILETVWIQMKTVYESNQKYIDIKQMEV
ncbi:MAG: ribosomal-processing cysteine protease Prp [Erysipelotrichia bacterium]|nr:ribosomal-processing cysteine protease Prp [Erysipelotrichia bacterium]